MGGSIQISEHRVWGADCAVGGYLTRSVLGDSCRVSKKWHEAAGTDAGGSTVTLKTGRGIRTNQKRQIKNFDQLPRFEILILEY